MVRPVVHSVKHINQYSLASIIGGAKLDLAILTAVAREDVNVPSEVAEGSIVKAVYLEIWARAGETTAGSGQLVVYKQQSDTSTATATEMAALNDWDNKRNIFYTTMGLFNDQDADAIALFKGWIKIPKGKQRMGLGDNVTITIFTPTIDLHICGFSLFKEYS